MPAAAISPSSSAITGSSSVPAMPRPRSRIGRSPRWASWNAGSRVAMRVILARSVPFLEPWRAPPRSDRRDRRRKPMKRTALLLSLALLWAAAAGAEEVVRSFRQQIPAAGLEKISIDFPVGEVTVEAWDGSQVDLDVKLACNHSITNRCADAAKAVRLVYDNSGDRLRV